MKINFSLHAAAVAGTAVLKAAIRDAIKGVRAGAAAMAAALALPTVAVAQPADYYRSPVDIPIYLSANFGEIRTNRFHTGVDIKTQGVTGKPLYAAADGYVYRVTIAPGGYGRALHIAHPNGTTTTYAHMERFTDEVEAWICSERYRLKQSDVSVFPAVGQFPVKQGDRIGLSGNSGASGGPHLHFEVRRSSDQQPLNVAARGWITTAAADRTPPRITRLYHIDIDTVAGVPIHSKPRAYDVTGAGGQWSLARTAPLRAGPTSYFVVQATDRRADVTNTFGIYRATMAEDGVERVVFEKDGVTFDDIRYACASVLYDVQRRAQWGNEAVMLAVKSGNRLPMYKRAEGRGAVVFAEGDTASKQITITVADDAGNLSTLAFDVVADAAHTAPERPAGRVATERGNFVHSADGLAVMIPKGALHEPIFYTQTTVDVTVTPRADSIRPLSPLYRTGDGTLPLHTPMRLGITATVPERLRPRACLASVSNGALRYVGGSWSNGSVNGTSRDFGVFCVVADATKPRVRASFADGADLTRATGFTLTATDNFSGIASFAGTIDGEWIIFEREAAAGRFIHRFDPERLRSGTTHTLEFTVRDGAGNVTVWRGSFRK